MADFGDIDDFNDQVVQGKPIKAYRNGQFENPKTLFVQHHWTWDEFLCAASQRLEMVPMASRVFNADGAEIDDIMCIEENDMLFFSTGAVFKAPGSAKDDSTPARSDSEKFGTIGPVVGGYKVSTLLGRGGFGEVRLGVHQLTNDRVALKFILKGEMGSLGDVERTTTEIQCLTALNHPSIIKLIRVVNEPNHVVLVIELLEGGDLFHYLKSLPNGHVSEQEGVSVFTQILSGVGYAHNQHICHRDLKLENILLSNKNDISSVKVADFGLSDFYKPGAMMKTSCGSISYLAPEVFRGTSNAGPPLDVWSLGVILFATVCGRLPFEGSDLHGSNRPRESVIRSRILKCQYKIDENLSAPLADLIAQMLKPDPTERITIPEIFNHPWVRSANCSIPPVQDTRLDSADDEGGFVAIQYPTKPATTTGVTSSSASNGDHLPTIVQRSPSRLDPNSTASNGTSTGGGGAGAGGGVAITPLSVSPGNTRSRATKMPDNLVQPKQLSPAKENKSSPRLSGTPGSPNRGSGNLTSNASSPVGATMKRYPSAVSSRNGRQRTGIVPGESEKDILKSHTERAPLHANEDKLPSALHKAVRKADEYTGVYTGFAIGTTSDMSEEAKKTVEEMGSLAKSVGRLNRVLHTLNSQVVELSKEIGTAERQLNALYLPFQATIYDMQTAQRAAAATATAAPSGSGTTA